MWIPIISLLTQANGVYWLQSHLFTSVATHRQNTKFHQTPIASIIHHKSPLHFGSLISLRVSGASLFLFISIKWFGFNDAFDCTASSIQTAKKDYAVERSKLDNFPAMCVHARICFQFRYNSSYTYRMTIFCSSKAQRIMNKSRWLLHQPYHMHYRRARTTTRISNIDYNVCTISMFSVWPVFGSY